MGFSPPASQKDKPQSHSLNSGKPGYFQADFSSNFLLGFRAVFLMDGHPPSGHNTRRRIPCELHAPARTDALHWFAATLNSLPHIP